MKETRSNLPVVCSFLLACTFAVTNFADVPFKLTVLEEGQGFAQGVYAIGDIDLDGKNDIVAGEGSPRLVWYPYPINRGKKHTIASSVSSVGYEIHLADMDADGDLDVLSSTAGVTWWENPKKPNGNPASGTWQKHSFGSFSDGSHDFKIGDINNDGRMDMVERSKARAWHMYLQKTDGTFQTFTVNAANDVEGTALGDIDKDGDLDISDGWAWFECPGNPASGTWTRHNLGTMHPQTRVAIADLNGDKNPDIVSAPAEFGGNETVWYEAPANPRTGTWKKHVLLARNDPNFHTLQVGDIDLDGNNDILVATTNWGQHPANWRRLVFIWYNTSGDFSTWKEQKWRSERGIWQAVLGDVGSDGDLDIVGADFTGGNRGEFWESQLNPPPVAAKPLLSQKEYRVQAKSVTALLMKNLGMSPAAYVVLRPENTAGPARLFTLRGRRVGAQAARSEIP
jgi:hypothetical protein